MKIILANTTSTKKCLPVSDEKIYEVAISHCGASHNDALEMIEKNYGKFTWLFTVVSLCILTLQVVAACYTFANLPFPFSLLQIAYFSPSAFVPILLIAWFGKHDIRRCQMWREVQNHFAVSQELRIQPLWSAIFRPFLKVSFGTLAWVIFAPFTV